MGSGLGGWTRDPEAWLVNVTYTRSGWNEDVLEVEPQGMVPRDNATLAVRPYANFYFFWMLIPIANRRELRDYFL